MGMMIPTREPPQEKQQSPMDEVRALMARKEAIEAEIEIHHEILKTNSADLTTPLVDAEGFPRADIDVWAVRHARVRIIELRNDFKAILDSIAKALEAVHSDPSYRQQAELSTTSPPPEAPQVPFARVAGVHPGSPAATAGLLREDLVLSFGSLTKSAFQAGSLQPLGEFVARRENMNIPLIILRGEQRITLNLVPQKWGGRGLLGCHLVPHSI